MARLGRAQPFTPKLWRAPGTGNAFTGSQTRPTGIVVVSQARESARTRRWGATNRITHIPVFITQPKANFFTGSQTRPVQVVVVSQAVQAGRTRRWGGSDAVVGPPKLWRAPGTGNAFTGSQTRPTGIVVVSQALRRAAMRLGTSDAFVNGPILIRAPQRGAVGGAVVTAAPAQTVQVQVVGQAEQRARRRPPVGAKFIVNPQPPLVVSGPAGQTIVVTAQAAQRARRRPIFQPKLWRALSSPGSAPGSALAVIGQAIARARRPRPVGAKFITSPQTAPFPGQPTGIVQVLGQALQRARRRQKPSTQFITAPQVGAVTSSVTTGQRAGIYVRVVSEAVTRETQQRRGRGVPFSPQFILPPVRGAAPPPAPAVTASGEGWNPRAVFRQKLPLSAEEIALLLAIGVIDEDEAAVMLAMS